ncbi:uncharacterized protein LOC133852624 [Alnus glutinosa]|uniref:uncharacterized protein LOC133852624 n=1 Tax=Alnus glutinosa TaxID=3517 RepID=UPI002D781D50|nr:uncharacterized protein LOC133852624 [Alnus glutinosa]
MDPHRPFNLKQPTSCRECLPQVLPPSINTSRYFLLFHPRSDTHSTLTVTPSQAISKTNKKEEEEDRWRDMGKKSSSSFSICGLFKACFSGGSGTSDDHYSYDEGVRTYTSDGDGGRWVAEPGIDGLATVFIDKFHATRVADSYGAVTAT